MSGKIQEWTGERLETFIIDETMVEHLHRYSLAIQFVANKKVLDIACGEGYGANLLAKSANHITGIDIDTATIEKAKSKYNSANLLFQTGSILQIPFPENSFDVITCFETLEHVEEHKEVVVELKRVLKQDGILLISTPEKLNYSDGAEIKNSFHKKELYGSQFKTLLNSSFQFTSFYQQSSYITSTILLDNLGKIELFYQGDYNCTNKISSLSPVYWLALASDTEFDHLNPSIYYHHQSLSELIENEKKLLKKTITYRTGQFILFPFKKIRSLFDK